MSKKWTAGGKGQRTAVPEQLGQRLSGAGAQDQQAGRGLVSKTAHVNDAPASKLQTKYFLLFLKARIFKDIIQHHSGAYRVTEV